MRSLQAVLFILLCFLPASQSFTFPVTYIPSMWSDFDFWIERGKEVIQNVREIKRLIPLDQDVVFFRNVKISVAASLAAGLGMVNILYRLHYSC